MAGSLQDQLLKSGLADKATAKKVRTQKRKNKKKRVVDSDQVAMTEAAEAAKKQKKEKDLALNQQQQQQREEKAIQAQIVQLIKINAQPRGKGDTALNFTDNNIVKRLYVTDAIYQNVVKARLAVVRLDDEYILVPTPVADKIAQRDESFVVYRADKREEENQSVESNGEDDWYADYEIPDDLMW